MDFNLTYFVVIMSLALMIVNRVKVYKHYSTFHYAFWSAIPGILSMVSCRIHIKDNKIYRYPDRKGFVAVVTGGGRGIGAHLVGELIKCGMHVIVGVRNPDKCEELNKIIKDGNHPGTVELMKLDVSKMKSVKLFADKVKAKYPPIHLLVNNAGIIYADFQLTEDNFESHMATNYFGHFYLTHLLMDNLKLSGRSKGVYSRIVNLSSSAHYGCGINFGDINWKVDYDRMGAYAQSKAALLMVTRYHNRLLEKNQEPVRVYAVHPGVVDTSMVDLYRESGYLDWFLNIFLKKPHEGAISVAFACVDESLEGKGGHYLSNCKEGWSTLYSKDKSNQQRLHEITCKLLNIKKFGDVSF